MILSHSSSPRSAFTLMEILIAVVAFSIVLAAINAVFYGALRLRNKTVQSFDAAVPLQHALAIIRQDLSNLAPPGGTLSGNLQTSPTASGSNPGNSGANSSANARSTTTMGSQPGQGSPEFFTTGGSIDETSPWAEIQRVSYFLAVATNGTSGQDLFRSVTRNLLPSFQDQPLQQPLLGGVESIHFQYYDGTQWKDTWDSTTEQATRLPAAIRVRLALAAEEGGRAQATPIELVVPILVYGGTNQLAGGVE